MTWHAGTRPRGWRLRDDEGSREKLWGELPPCAGNCLPPGPPPPGQTPSSCPGLTEPGDGDGEESAGNAMGVTLSQEPSPSWAVPWSLPAPWRGQECLPRGCGASAHGFGWAQGRGSPPCPAGRGEGAPRARVSGSSLAAPDCQGMINGQRHRAAWAAKCCIVRADTERARTDSNTILPRNRQTTSDGRNSGSVPHTQPLSHPLPFPATARAEQQRAQPSTLQPPSSFQGFPFQGTGWDVDGNGVEMEMEAEFRMASGTGYKQRRRQERGWGRAGEKSFPPHLSSCTGNLKRQSRSAGTEFFQPYSQLSGGD